MNAKGFTLIELVVVLIVLGILSVTVVPKFFSSNGFSEYTYRTDIIAKLRLIQTRAMQQVNEACHQVLVTVNKLGKVTCDPPARYVDQANQRATLVTVDINDQVTFSPVDLSFKFDHMGRPVGCNNPCEIIIKGEQDLAVIIESEGYIHAR